MRVYQAAIVVGLLAIPALVHTSMPAAAQSMTPGFRLNEGKQYTDEEKERMKANEEAARAARSTLPDAKVSADPWAGARAAETPAKAKTVKPKQ